MQVVMVSVWHPILALQLNNNEINCHIGRNYHLEKDNCNDISLMFHADQYLLRLYQRNKEQASMHWTDLLSLY